MKKKNTPSKKNELHPVIKDVVFNRVKRNIEKRKKQLAKKKNIKRCNSYIKREDSQLEKVPDKKCNARLRRSDGYCNKPAGTKTMHPGVGRCYLHGGNAGRKSKVVEVYKGLLKKNDAVKGKGIFDELVDDKTIEGELAVSKLLVTGALDKYVNEEELTPEALLLILKQSIIVYMKEDCIRQYILSIRMHEDKKIRNDKFSRKDVDAMLPDALENALKEFDACIDVVKLSGNIIGSVSLAKMILGDPGEKLRKVLETTAKLAETHHDMTEGKKLVIGIEGVKEILTQQANIINQICEDCPKRIQVANRLMGDMKSDEAEFSVLKEEEKDA